MSKHISTRLFLNIFGNKPLEIGNSDSTERLLDSLEGWKANNQQSKKKKSVSRIGDLQISFLFEEAWNERVIEVNKLRLEASCFFIQYMIWG